MDWGGARQNSGGKRPGAGRKPKLTTQIREMALAEAGDDARYALGFVVSIMRDESQPLPMRYAASVEVMDRVWGKATQTNKNENSGELTVHVVYDDEEGDPYGARDSLAALASGAAAGDCGGAPL